VADTPDISEYAKHTFFRLVQAAKDDQLLLIATTSKSTGEPVFMICARGPHPADESLFKVYPLGTVFAGDPADEVNTPEGLRPDTRHLDS